MLMFVLALITVLVPVESIRPPVAIAPAVLFAVTEPLNAMTLPMVLIPVAPAENKLTLEAMSGLPIVVLIPPLLDN
jgi:hypothetical protein